MTRELHVWGQSLSNCPWLRSQASMPCCKQEVGHCHHPAWKELPSLCAGAARWHTPFCVPNCRVCHTGSHSGSTRSRSCSLGRIRAVMGNDFGFFLSSEGKRCVLSRQSVFWRALGLLLLGRGCLIVWLCCYSVCFIQPGIYHRSIFWSGSIPIL